jgi:electron transfer flavoprotein alpha subunit
MSKALVLIESKDGKVKKSSLEVVSALTAQGVEVDAILITTPAMSSKFNDIAKEIGAQGAKKLLTATHDSFSLYQADSFASTVSESFKSGGYSILAASAGAMAKDLFPTLAARLDLGLAVDCVDVQAKGGVLRAKRPMLAGKYFAWAKFKSGKGALTVRPNVLALAAATSNVATVSNVEPKIDQKAKTVKLIRNHLTDDAL